MPGYQHWFLANLTLSAPSHRGEGQRIGNRYRIRSTTVAVFAILLPTEALKVTLPLLVTGTVRTVAADPILTKRKAASESAYC